MVGFGGHAKSVADCIERQRKYKIVGYTDLEMHTSKYTYLGTDAVLRSCYDRGIGNAAVGLGYMGKGAVRTELYERLKAIGYNMPIIMDPSAIISETAQIGEGSFIGKSAVVNAEAIIGKMAIINTKALIEHECVVGDFTHVAVGAVLCGQVEVGKEVFIGANATIIQNMHVPSNTVIPAGETVRGKCTAKII